MSGTLVNLRSLANGWPTDPGQLVEQAMSNWQPFRPVSIKTRSEDQAQALALARNLPVAAIREAERHAQRGAAYANDRYLVIVHKAPDDMVYLVVNRLDREPVRDWRDLQRIKNELIGPECEAVELFPAESRLVDTANMYHLWGCTDPSYRFPFGYQQRAVR
jgi:hypothetical protein